MGPTLDYEIRLWQAGHYYIAGVDEVGRGCLAGPVVAGAVILPVDDRVICNVLRAANVRDSKKLSFRQREGLVPLIKEVALGVAIGEASSGEIDAYGIVAACRLAMARALRALPTQPTALLIDGPRSGSFFSLDQRLMSDDEILQLFAPKTKNDSIISDIFGQVDSPLLCTQCNVVRGDSASLSIAAAAIIAKVYRDNFMIEVDSKFLGYGFASHKGYGTSAHLAALRKLGPTPIHRMTWKPLRELHMTQMELDLEDKD